MFLVLIAIQATLLLYYNPSEVDSSIWNFVTNLDSWNNLNFIEGIVGIALGIGLVGIAAASIFGYKTDFLLFAGAISGFASLGIIFTNLAGAIKNSLTSSVFYCDPTLTDLADCLASQGTASTFIIAITLGPIALYYIWTIVEWWRGKDY